MNMSTTLEEKFMDYKWHSLLKGELSKNKFFDEETLSTMGVQSFSDKFSPRVQKGFFENLFKGKEYHTRDKEDAINFIVNSGLVKNKEDAEEFIETFKNERIDYFGMKYFQLTELKNVEGAPIYLTEFANLYWVD